MADESSDNQEQPTSGQQSPNTGSETPPANFEEWLGQQNDATRTLIENHTNGLKTALDDERAARKKTEKELRDAAKKLEAGSDTRQALEETANKLAAQTRQTTFYDAAHTAGVTNLRLAYLAAQEAGLVDDDGKADFEKFKEQYPELFPQKPPAPAPKANAGSGSGGKPSTPLDMSARLRRAAGIT